MRQLAQAMSRRGALARLGALALTPLAVEWAKASARPDVTMHRDPSCGCCGGWAEHLKAAGFPVSIVNTTRLNAVKAQLGVPASLWSCHTAEVGGYIIEGHVPAAAIDSLLEQRPAASGLAAPGMPVGSPGMEGGEPEVFEVVLFGPAGQRVFGRYRGDRAV